MIIIHNVNSNPSRSSALHGTRPFPRSLTKSVVRALKDFPVVVLAGARQTGKSTLMRELLPETARDYRTLDDIDMLERAQKEPEALISSKGSITVDEIHKSPELLLAIKRAVDRDRKPGRFLLSGSANLALLGKGSETLAGRAVYLTLYPFTPAERAGLGTVGQWDRVLANPSGLEGTYPPFTGEESLLRSGFPPAALIKTQALQRTWLDGYARTYLERDLQTLSAIEKLVDFRRLMRIAALRSGSLINQSQIARDAGLSQPTAHRYLNLLETSYLLHRLQPYSVNRTKRLVKAPRLFFCDTGLAAYLAGIETMEDLEKAGLTGAFLETLVFSDLLAWRETLTRKPEVLYWRTVSGAEVDFVLEQDGKVIPLEVKAGGRPRAADIQHLRVFLDEYGKSSPHGILLHAGQRCEQLAERIWAVHCRQHYS